MNKITVVVNDFEHNLKTYISYNAKDIAEMERRWDIPDEHLINLQVLDPFVGYTKWSELSPNHYRLLITRALNVLSQLDQDERSNSLNVNVSMTNFIILAFITRLECLTMSEIEHFRVNRFDDLSVTYDFSGSFEVLYDRPLPKDTPLSEPSFTIIVDNSSDDSND